MPRVSMPVYIPDTVHPYYFASWVKPVPRFLDASRVAIPNDDRWLQVPINALWTITPWVVLGSPEPIDPTASDGFFEARLIIGHNPARMTDNAADNMRVDWVTKVISEEEGTTSKTLEVENPGMSLQHIVVPGRPDEFFVRRSTATGRNIDPGDIVRMAMVAATW